MSRRTQPRTIAGASRDLTDLWRDGTAVGRTDGELLRRFADREADAERCFALLVERHGPMVRRIGLGLLRDPHAADDALQSTFLVLARKAGRLGWRVGDSLAPWLQAVAWRVALHARSDTLRRRERERRAASLRGERATPDPVPTDEVAILFDELGRLPEDFRRAVVLCDLEGLSHEEAAHRLGCPMGTVKSRQARGRDRLRGRLERRGVAPSLATILLPSAAPAPALVDSIARSATAAATISLPLGLGLILSRKLIGFAALAGTVAAVGWVASRTAEPIPPRPAPSVPIVAAERADSVLTIRVLDPEGKETKAVALMLWKELGAEERADEGGFVWTDTSTKRRWAYYRNWNPGYPAPEPFGFHEVPAGTYRVSATTFKDDSPKSPSPYAVSEPITLAASTFERVELRHQTPAESDLLLEISDRATEKPVPFARVRLRRQTDDFPIFRGWGNGLFADTADEKGYAWYGWIPKGSYRVEVLGRPASRFGDLEYESRAEPVSIDFQAGAGWNLYRFYTQARPLSRDEIDRRWPYVIRGVVTDDQGRPLPGVDLHATAGMGTLRRTGSTSSGPDGSYLLRFTQGMMTPADQLGTNAVVIGVDHPGYFARDLALDPHWMIASRALTDTERGQWEATEPDRWIIANEPRTLDLSLVPAAQVVVALKNGEGEPTAGWSIGVKDDDDQISNNALPGGETDRRGLWACDLPPGLFRFVATPPREANSPGGATSEPVALPTAGRYVVRLRLTRPDNGPARLDATAEPAGPIVVTPNAAFR